MPKLKWPDTPAKMTRQVPDFRSDLKWSDTG